MSEEFTTPEQALVERLRRAPQPELRAEAREAILSRILIAFENPPAPAPRPYLPRPVVLVAILMVGALIAAGVLFVLSQRQPDVTPTPQMTVTPAPVIVSSPAVSATPQPTLTPNITVTPTTSTITVIEGPIDRIDGSLITIYGIQVQVDPNDPILPTLVIGDTLRVEGNTQNTGSQIIIVAITTLVTTVDVNTNASSGEVWRDDGNCANPPPDWAPAHGWRRRCEGQDNKDNKQDKDDKKNNQNDDD